MPAIDPSNNRAAPKPKRVRNPRVNVPDRTEATRTKRAPRPVVKPTPIFKGPATATRPFQPQQTKAQQKVDASDRRVQAAPVSAPPVIRNPTPQQTKAAKRQIVQSVKVAVGTGGTAAQRNQRRDQLLRAIRTQPRYRQVRQSFEHWTKEDAKTYNPDTRERNLRNRVKAGPPPMKVKAAGISVNLSAVADTAGKLASKAAPGLRGKSPERQFVKNALSDVAHLPLMGPQTMYEVGAAAVEAAQGDTKRAKELVKGLTDGLIGNLATGDFEGAYQYAREHPVFAALELRGGKGLTGRGTGAVMRSGVTGKRAQRAASTKRGDLKLTEDGRVRDRQHYSPDVFTKLLQVAAERKREGKPRLQDHRLRRRADFESDTAAAMSRVVRGDEANKARQAKPKGPLADVVGLVVQGVVREKSVQADLRKELQRLDDAHATAAFSTGAQKRQNRTTAENIRKVLGSPQAMARISELAASGRANVRAINDLERKAQDLGAQTGPRAERAALFPAAQAHLGAKHQGMTRTQGRQVVSKARKELERSRGARDHVLERLKAEGVKKPTTHPDYVKAAARVKKARDGVAQARELRRSGAVMLRDHNNDPLPNAAIRKELDGQDVAYLPHHTQQRGARAYYQTAFAGRKNLDSSKKRTGAAFEKGAVDVSYEAVAEHRIRVRGVVNRIAEHDRIISDIAITGPKTSKNPTGMMTWDQAEKIASNAKDGGAKLVPYRAVPGSYDRDRISQIAASQNAAEMPSLARLIEKEFEERLMEPAPGDRTARNVVLVPEQIVNQLKAQQNLSGSTRGAAGNIAADVFRRTVLPFSVKWVLGNLAEATMRLAYVGAGPNSYRIGRKVLKELDELDHDQALRVKAALTGGLLFGNRGLTVRRFAEHFEGTSMESTAKVVGAAGRLPVVHQLGRAIKETTDAIFAFNRSIEQASQVAALGKYAKRDMQEMTGSWAKATRAQQKALEDMARGLMDTKNVHDAARYIDQTLGQYSRFSPGMRRFVQSYTPFLPWYLNSARFVMWTLPAKHPIKTGIYATLAGQMQEDFDEVRKSLPPGLRSGLVTGDGTVFPVGGLTPYGAFDKLAGGGDEQLLTFVDPFFPQFKTAALAAFGMNFTGKKASIPAGDRDDQNGVPGAVRASMAFNALMEAFVPGVSQAKRIREGGSTGYDNSNVLDPKTKPGTRVTGGAANRILNPLRPSPIKAGNAPRPKSAAKTAVATQPASLEDQLLDNLDQSLGDAQAQQQLEDELLSNLYGDG